MPKLGFYCFSDWLLVLKPIVCGIMLCAARLAKILEHKSKTSRQQARRETRSQAAHATQRNGNKHTDNNTAVYSITPGTTRKQKRINRNFLTEYMLRDKSYGYGFRMQIRISVAVKRSPKRTNACVHHDAFLRTLPFLNAF